jgi:excisionase family DNA binding protein
LVVQGLSGPLLTVGEAAARLRVSRATVYRLVRADVLQVVRISNSIRVPTEAFDRAPSRLQKQTNGPMQ